MGYRLIFASLSMMFLLTGCIVDKVWTTRYVYVNESGVEIVINQYFDEAVRERDKITLGNSLIKEETDIEAVSPPFAKYAKIEILFNDEKNVIYLFDEYDKKDNPYLKKNYSKIQTNEKRTTVYEYTFTPEMYEQATPIEP